MLENYWLLFELTDGYGYSLELRHKLLFLTLMENINIFIMSLEIVISSMFLYIALGG